MDQTKFKNDRVAELIKFLRQIKNNDLKLNRIKGETDKMLNKRDIEELTNRVKGMSDEELEIVVENIPVDLCLKRINDEIEKGRALRKYVTDAMKLTAMISE